MPGTPTVAKQAVSLSGTKIIGVDGNEVQLRGLNVFGFENGVTAPDGIWQVRSLALWSNTGTDVVVQSSEQHIVLLTMSCDPAASHVAQCCCLPTST